MKNTSSERKSVQLKIHLLRSNYHLGPGAGSFGDIYVGEHVETGERVAVKLELVGARHPQLQYESKVYALLRGGEGIGMWGALLP